MDDDRLTEEEKEKLNKFIDSIEIGISDIYSATSYKNTYRVWKVPVIGHLVVMEDNVFITTRPILNTAFDFGIEPTILLKDEEIKAILPAEPGEYVIKTCIPSEPVKLDFILADNFDDIETITLVHCAPNIPEKNWKEELRETLHRLARTNTKEQ